MADRKKLTAKQKKQNSEIRRRLKEEGLLPPDKKPLRRKPYIQEAKEKWSRREYSAVWDCYLYRAISYVLTQREHNRIRSPSLEAIGAAKVLLIALQLHELDGRLSEAGRSSHTLQEEFDNIQEILDR